MKNLIFTLVLLSTIISYSQTENETKLQRQIDSLTIIVNEYQTKEFQEALINNRLQLNNKLQKISAFEFGRSKYDKELQLIKIRKEIQQNESSIDSLLTISIKKIIDKIKPTED